MLTPIFIPAHSPETCPRCKQLKNKVEICNNCGYNYPEDEAGCLGFILFFFIFLFAIWFIITLCQWFSGLDGVDSLHEVIGNQIDFIANLRL